MQISLNNTKNITNDNLKKTKSQNIFKYINKKDKKNNNNFFLLQENENELENVRGNCHKCFFNEYECEINLCEKIGYKEVFGYKAGTSFKYPIIIKNKYFTKLEEYKKLFLEAGGKL